MLNKKWFLLNEPGPQGEERKYFKIGSPSLTQKTNSSPTNFSDNTLNISIISSTKSASVSSFLISRKQH